MFNLLDTDQDGLLGVEELVEGFKPMKNENVIDQDLTEIALQTVKYADQDGDGKLNFTEFKHFYTNLLQINI
jgi:serine/threonine-protein phosphatase 2B regulatory subunit